MIRHYQDTLLFLIALSLALWIGARQVKLDRQAAIQSPGSARDFTFVTESRKG